ncbi:hypothetical protein ASD38_00880 [Caulobacter sp. Root487D2Y]|uniref:DUF2252 family protein n=1 Tax=Caulobacter sp. Root487D2Y TaxID=1736547 RepID=UPI0006F2B258|nr:DUF2252 family protein [Caulobacter sp. Root487D2Y]KQY35158.1 hypothetical protein ASD38_00880 [Caulobacter sp. Root487D2Y]
MTASIKASVKAYEAWLAAALGGDLVEADLAEKHDKMREGPFPFLRATYWRWAETIFETCPDLASAPAVLAIGDTHVENFGCWRDAEGRLVWGANDFDDAAAMPYPLDLVRLAASALLAREDRDPGSGEICAAILAGYAAGLVDPRPFILERDHKWLRKAVMLPETERAAYWAKFAAPAPRPIPLRYREALRGALPDPAGPFETFPRTAGVGSLGRPRFVARADWRGGPVLREVKAVVVSAWVLRHGGDPAIRAGVVAGGRFRAVDPRHHVADGLVVRRLSPNSRKIEAKGSADELLSPDMLTAMSREIAACHAGDPGRAPALLAHLRGLPPDWLRVHAKAAARQVEADQAAFT